MIQGNLHLLFCIVRWRHVSLRHVQKIMNCCRVSGSEVMYPCPPQSSSVAVSDSASQISPVCPFPIPTCSPESPSMPTAHLRPQWGLPTHPSLTCAPERLCFPSLPPPNLLSPSSPGQARLPQLHCEAHLPPAQRPQAGERGAREPEGEGGARCGGGRGGGAH